MRRDRNWDTRLLEVEREVIGRPFVWGETDCASLVVRAVQAMYPEDPPLPPDLPDYDSEAGALRAHSETGGVEEALRAHGAAEVPLAYCQQGDILVGLDPQGGVPGAAFCFAGYYIVASEEEGVVRRRVRDLRERGGEGVTVLRLPQ